MVATTDTIRVALFALLTGAVLPLLVQLFLTLRSLRSAMASMERRINELAIDAKSGPSASLGAVVGAALPAILAAVHAFRASMHTQNGDNDPKESSPQPR